MSLFKPTITAQGGILVKRDEKGNVVAKAAPVPGAPRVESWRSQMRRVNAGGMDTLLHIASIARGDPQRSTLPTGEYTDWTVPTIAEQLQASQFIAEFQLGKAVAQTEVIKAEAEADEHAQLSAMSDAALRDAARPFLERVEKKLLAEGEEE